VTIVRGFIAGILGVFGMAGVSLTMRRLVQPTAPIGVTHYENVVKVARATLQPDKPELDRDTQVRVSEFLHLAFGGFWGVIWALARRDSDIRPFVDGIGFGTVVWAAGFGTFMPGLRLAKGLWEMDAYELARTWGSHVGYGVATSLVLGSRRTRTLNP
jgi:hypothetical protein